MVVDVKDEKDYALNDLMFVYHSNMYINEKKYLTVFIDTIYKMGYYENGKSIFREVKAE